MKNYIKKIIVGVFGIALIFSAQRVFAVSTWNQASNDCSSINIVNATTNEGYSSPCWIGTNVSASAGDTVNVRIYYHNTGTVTSTNTSLVLSAPSNNTSGTYKSFTGRIVSDQGSLSFGPVAVNLSSSQTLSFYSVKWYTNNTSETLTPLLSGQNGSEVLANGLAIGSIAPGWTTQGSVVVAFKVSSTVVPQLCTDPSATNYNGPLPCNYPQPVCTISNFTTSPSSISSGSSSTLSWNTTNCTSATIYPTLGNVAVSGSQTVWPTTSTLYTLTAYDAMGSSKTSTTTVTVNAPTTYTITATSNAGGTITPSGVTTYSYNGSQAYSVVPLSGYTLTNVSIDGVSVGTVPTYGYYTSFTYIQANHTISAIFTPVSLPMTGTLTSSTSSCVIASGSSTCSIPFTWSTQNPVATSAVTHNGVTIATGNSGSQSFNISNGSQSYYLYNNSVLLDTDTVSASCASNSSWSGSYCAPVIVPVCTINNFTASPTSITAGDSSTLSWNTSNCTSANISSIGSVSTTGSQAIYPTTSTTYTLTAYGASGISQTKVVTVVVNPVILNCSINNLTASPTLITSGGSSTLSWNTTNCTSATIYPALGNVNVNGSQAVWPTTSTTYTLTAYGVSGAPQTRTIVVSVDQPAQICSINSLTASSTSITSGGSSTLSWNTTNCTSATIYPALGNVNVNGSQAVWPTTSTTYTLTAYGVSGAPQTRTIVICVNQPILLCQDPSATNYHGSLPCTYPQQLLCRDTSASNYGSPLPCTYPVRICQDYSASNYGGSLPCTYPQQICRDPQATNYNGSLPCQYYQQQYNNCTVSNFQASNNSVRAGDPVTLTWNTNYCSSVYISGLGSVSNSGSYRVYPLNTNTYTINATGNNGSDSLSLSIYVDTNNYNYNYTNNYNYSSPSVSTYTPTNITNYGATLNGYTNGNGSLVNSWIELPCYGNAYGNVYNQSSSNISVPVSSLSPNTTYSYCVAAQSSNNNQIYRGNSISFMTAGQNYVNTISYVNKDVVTTVATNITRNQAQVNGYITNSSYLNSNTYFEYGSTVNLGLRTQSKSINGSSNLSDTLTGLNPNTIYYFQAVSEGQGGVSRGSIEIFKTLGETVTQRQIIIQGTTVIGTESPIMLNISNNSPVIDTGDVINYVVTYKNIGKSKLTKPMVQVMLPTNITLVNASRGTYAVDTHTLSAPIEDLNPNQDGVIFIQARVDSIPSNNSQIATTAILVYTNTNGAQENAMAYVLNVPKNISNTVNDLGASVFFGGILSLGLIGWLIILLIILLLILIIRSFYSRNSNQSNTHPTTPVH